MCSFTHLSFLVGWLVGRSVGRTVSRLVGWLVGWGCLSLDTAIDKTTRGQLSSLLA